jgi:hypothetical protein
MSFKPVLLPLTLILVLGSWTSANADESATTVDSRVTKVGLFKNGVACVSRTVELPGPGTFEITDLPEPVHGTYWIESNARVTARTTSRMVDVALTSSGPTNLSRQLAGAQVTLRLRDEYRPTLTGRVMSAPETDERTWSRDYERERYGWWSHQPLRGSNNVGDSAPSRFLAVETADGTEFIDTSLIMSFSIQGALPTHQQRQPVMIVEADHVPSGGGIVNIFYLTKGMAWAPSYRIDLLDDQQLAIDQKAVIRNELTHLDDVEVELISGFPNVEFSHVVSPFAHTASLASFFDRLAVNLQSGLGRSAVMTQQAVMYNRPAPDAWFEPPMDELGTSTGVDLHFRSIGRHSLAPGDSLLLPLQRDRASYERIVEWIVPDTRDAYGRQISRHVREADPERYRDAAWDAIRFDNPFDDPMTTAPAMIVDHGRFQGQRLSPWVTKSRASVRSSTSAATTTAARRCAASSPSSIIAAPRQRWSSVANSPASCSKPMTTRISISARRAFTRSTRGTK